MDSTSGDALPFRAVEGQDRSSQQTHLSPHFAESLGCEKVHVAPGWGDGLRHIVLAMLSGAAGHALWALVEHENSVP